MGIEFYLCFLDLRKLGLPGSLESLVQSIRHNGFDVTQLSVGYNFGTHFYAEVGENGLGEEELLAIAYEHNHLKFNTTFSPKDSKANLEVSMSFEWNVEHDGRFRSLGKGFNWQTLLFLEDADESKLFSGIYLHLGTIVYQILQPAFGWLDTVDFGEGIYFDQLDNQEISPTDYWATFFGPELMEKLGWQRVSNAEFQIMGEFQDGGVLVQTGPSIYERHFTTQSPDPIEDIPMTESEIVAEIFRKLFRAKDSKSNHER